MHCVVHHMCHIVHIMRVMCVMLCASCALRCWRDDEPIFFNIPTPTSVYISNFWLHLILSTAPIIDFPSNMPYSQVMQSSSSTIALQPLTSQWSLDADDYHIHSKNHHRLYPPPCAKLSHLKSIIKWPKKSSPPTSLPYHIGNPIFFEDSFIPYAFVNFVDSDDYNSAQRKECVVRLQSQPKLLFLQFNSGCIVQDNMIMPNHNTYPDGLGSKPSHAAILAADSSSSDSFNWLTLEL